MKSRLIYIATVILLLFAATGFNLIDTNQGRLRYWQHKEAKIPAEEKPKADFVTHLPIVSIDTGGEELLWITSNRRLFNSQNELLVPDYTGPRDILTRDCTISVISDEGAWHTLQDTPNVTEHASVRIRGNSSKWFYKKSYMVHILDEDGSRKNVSVMGMSKASEWVLNGPCLDRTLIRNYLCYNVSGQIMEYAPDVRFCEVFLNGEYRGVYLMVEAITRDEGRINLTKTGESQDVTGWLVRWDRERKRDTPVDNYTYYSFQAGVSGMDLRYPGKDTLTPEKLDFVESDVSRIERSIYSSDLSDKKKGYQAYLDVEAFAQYFVINEFFGNVDAGRFSTYLYKDVRGKVVPVVWDFNNACNNYIDYVYGGGGFNMSQSPWFGRLLHDRTFVEEVISQYRRLRKSVLSDEYLERMVDDTIAYLGDAIERNYEVYGFVFEEKESDTVNYLNPMERNYSSYEEAVAQLKSWMKIRGAWMDAHIESLLQYCQDSKNAAQIID